MKAIKTITTTNHVFNNKENSQIVKMAWVYLWPIKWVDNQNTFANSIQASPTSTTNHLLILTMGQKWTANIWRPQNNPGTTQWQNYIIKTTMADCLHKRHHRLNGSSSPVLTATSLSYGESKNSTPHRIKTPYPIEIKFGTVDYISEGTRHAKFYANSSKGGFSANGWNIRKNFYLYIPFFLPLTHRSDLLRDFYA